MIAAKEEPPVLKIGAVGCGGVGLKHQLGYVNHPQADLVCVCDLDKDKADARAEQIGVKAYYSIQEMLAGETLDAVDVVTADHLHFAPVMECLEAGIHTMCEKPLSLEIDEAEQMVAKAAEKGVHLAIDYNRRFAPAYRKAREWVDAGDLGELSYIMMKLSQGGPASTPKGEYYLLYELQTHAIDLLRYFGGEIKAVCAQMAKPRLAQAKEGEPSVYTSMAVGLKYETEAVATLLASWDSDFVSPIEHFEMCGSKGEIVVDNIMSEARYHPRNHDEVRRWRASIFRPEQLAFDGSFGMRVAAFVDDLVAGREPVPAAKDAIQAMRVVEAIVQSWQAQRTVEVNG